MSMISQALLRMMPPLLDLTAQPPNQVNLLIHHLQFLFIDLRIQLGEDMVMVKPETCFPQRLCRLLDPPVQQAPLLLGQAM